MTWLLGLVSLLSFAQGDIPIKQDVVPPSADFIRPVYVPNEGLKYRKSDGSYINGRTTRDPRLFLTWPAYLIQNPVLGDHAMGPSLTADTTQRQHAIFNGNRWVILDKPIELIFGSAFSKTGTTVNLNQYPNSIGNIHANQISLASAPAKPANPQQHTFLLYNPLTGKFEGMPYADVVSAMGVVQWPSGSIGHIGVDGLYWQTLPQLLSASNLDEMNASFLVSFGNNTFRMSLGDYLNLVRTRLGPTSGFGGLIWGNTPPANQDSPGATNEARFYQGKIYLKTPTKWLRINNVDSVFTTDYQPPSADPVPLLTGQYDQSKSKIGTTWNYTASDVTSWDLFASFNQDNKYELLKSGIAAGDRSYSFDVAGGVTTYFLQVRGQKTNGLITPFSNTATVTVTQQAAWSPFVEVSTAAMNDAGSIQVRFYNTQAGGKAYLQITTNANASATSDEGWTSLATLDLPNEGQYAYTFTGIGDTKARYIRLWKEGTPRTPSAKQKVGPVALQSIPVQINAPIVTSVTNVTSTSATFNFNWNNTNVVKGFIYQSLAQPQDYTRTELAANATSYTATNLKPGTKYLFHFQAVKQGDLYSPYSTPETEVTTTGTAEDVFPAPSMDYYENGTRFSNPSKDYVMFKKPQGIPDQPGQWDYRVGDGAWTFGDKETNAASSGYTPSPGWGSNFFFHDKFQAGQTVRFRVRLWDYNNNKPNRYSIYSDILKVVYGPNYRVNGNVTDFTVTKEAADQTPTGQIPPTSQPLSVSILSQTASQITLSIANPKQSGTVSYNMSVYKRGDPNISGSYQCSKGSRPGTSTITYDLSDCPIVTGGEYTLYIAEDNGNQPQTRQSSVNFVQQGSGGTSTQAIRGIVFGNSILSHGEDLSQGWTPKDGRGMAATAADKDFFSIIQARMKALNPSSTLAKGGSFDFERNYWNDGYYANGIQQQCYDKDLVIIRLGENVDSSLIESKNLYAKYSEMIDLIRAANPSMRIAVTTAFWSNTGYDAVVRQLVLNKQSTQSPIVLADFSSFANQYNLKAYSDWPNASQGVKEHPGDAGHLMIANKIWESFNTLYAGNSGDPGNGEIVIGQVPAGVRTDVPSGTKIYTTPYYRIGVDYQAGGSFRQLYSPASSTENMINNHDLGRQLQWAIYGWDIPWLSFQQPHPYWLGIGWDPIQTGDMSTPSRVTQWYESSDGKSIYFRTVPQMWGYFDLACECHVDNYVKIKDKVVEQTQILYNKRTDSFQNLPRGQDVGGGFLNSPYYKIKFYEGDQPWTSGALTDWDLTSDVPAGIKDSDKNNAHFWTPENWMYLYSPAKGNGVGVWGQEAKFSATYEGRKDEPGWTEYSGDYGTFGTHIRNDHIDRNVVYKFESAFVFGSAEDTRAYAYTRRNDTRKIDADFSKDKQHWWANVAYAENEMTQYPHPGYWGVDFTSKVTNFASPTLSVPASSYTKLEIVAAVTGQQVPATITLLKHRNNARQYNNQYGTAYDDLYYSFQPVADGQFRTYTIDLSTNPQYGGILSQMYLDFNMQPGAGRGVKIKSIKGLP